MNRSITFGKEGITNYFENSRVSKIYEDFYSTTHTLDDISSVEADNMIYICRAIKAQISLMLSRNKKNVSYTKNNLYAELIDSPEYQKTIALIKQELGDDVVSPYLEEFELIGRLRRSLKVTLGSVYAGFYEILPKKLQNILHQDYKKVATKDLDRIISRLESHPDKDKFTVDDGFRECIDKVYLRVLAVEKFYQQHKEINNLIHLKTDFFGKLTGEVIPLEVYRDNLFDALNKKFGANQ